MIYMAGSHFLTLILQFNLSYETIVSVTQIVSFTWYPLKPKDTVTLSKYALCCKTEIQYCTAYTNYGFFFD
jgi:hypothetical protein